MTANNSIMAILVLALQDGCRVPLSGLGMPFSQPRGRIVSEPRDHHYVPRFYLSGWCGPDNCLTCYTVRHGRARDKRIGPKGIGFERDLYSFHAKPDDVGQIASDAGPEPARLLQILQEHLDGRRTHTEEEFRQLFEKLFTGGLDASAAKVLQKLREGQLDALTPEERLTWAAFLISLPLRNPDAVRDIRESTRASIQAKTAEQLGEAFPELADADADGMAAAVLATDEVFQRLSADYGLWVIQGIVSDPEYQDKLASLHWWTMDFTKSKHSLLTANRPYVALRPLSHPRSLIYVPLGPRLGFFASPDREKKRQLSRGDISKLAGQMNDFIVRLAVGAVYGADCSQLSFVEKRLRPDPGGPESGSDQYA